LKKACRGYLIALHLPTTNRPTIGDLMQDTKNLKRKIKEYKKMIAESLLRGNKNNAEYWSLQLRWVKEKIAQREKNKRKNEKQYRKAN